MNPFALGIGGACVGLVLAEVRPFWFGWWYIVLLWIETLGKAGPIIAKPLGACAMCTSGMLTLVGSVALCPANYPSHIIAPCVAILAALGLEKYYAWTQQ